MASRKSKSKKKQGRSVPRPVPRPVPSSPLGATRNAPEKEFAGLKPKPATNERVEDFAVFSNVGREQLSDALKLECTAVMASLDSAAEGEFAQANDRLKDIPRSSPYADWRLFIRGLCGFYAKDFETAKQNWQRLDATRRPARIANTLISAELNEPLAEFAAPIKRLVEAARTLLHRSVAVAAAKQIMSVKHRDSEVHFSTSQVAMLTNFRDDFRRVDAEFVTKFSQACVYRACTQDDPSAFMLLKKSVPGPAHDPRWNLQEFLFMREFQGVEEDRQETAEAYIEKDLPGMTQFSKDQKGALASCIYLDLARMFNEDQREMPFFFFSEPPDYKTIEQLLGKAIKKYPANREAHRFLFDILDRQIETQRRVPKSQIEAAEKRLIKAKEAYVSAFPGEIEISLELVDHYFGNDEHDKAEALVKQLSSQRLDAPLAKALPWKLKLLSAMHSSRKKTELSSVRESLAIADSQWPTWFPRTWLPFLKAALELRVGNQEQFESLDKQARQNAATSSVACDFMTFAAMQQMNVPAAVIKPYRETITKYLDNVEQMPLADLISIGAFFWDLTRAGLEHKGFRLQAAKVGKAICARLKKGETVPHSSEFIQASCFCAGRGFWQNGYEFRQPAWAEGLSKTEPQVGASFIGWVNKSSYPEMSLVKFKPLIDAIQAAAKTEKDPFHRYRFEQVALSANELIEEFNRKRSAPSTVDRFFGATREDDDDNEFEEECQCAECKANRARAASRSTGAQSSSAQSSGGKKRSTGKDAPPQLQPMFDFGDDDDDDDFEDESDDDESEDFAFEMESTDRKSALDAVMARIATLVGPEQMMPFVNTLIEVTSNSKNEQPSVQLGKIVQVFRQFGLPYEEAAKFILAIGAQFGLDEAAEFEVSGTLPGSSPAFPPQPRTAEERRAADMKRPRA